MTSRKRDLASALSSAEQGTLSAETDRDFPMDSLPYVDTIHEDYEDYALSLIEKEMKITKPPKMAVMKPIRYRTKLMKVECDILADGQRSEPLHLRPTPKDVSEISTEEELMAEIRLARALYEAERQRSMILDIQKSEIAANQWKAYIANVLEPLESEMRQLAQFSKDKVDDINIAREKHQTQDAGPTLHKLNAKYQDLLHKKFQLQSACRNLQIEITDLKKSDGVDVSNEAVP